jgi:hypothetical protein
MPKLFKIAGVSRLNANAGFKLRVANGKLSARQKVLERNGHVDIQLVDLPHEMSKPQILAWFSLDKPSLAAKLDGKAPKEEPAKEAKVVELTKDAKLLLKRAKDAARKREKRAAEKAAKLASIQEKVGAEQASI